MQSTWAMIGLGVVVIAILGFVLVQLRRKAKLEKQARAARIQKKRKEAAMPPKATANVVEPYPKDAPTRRATILVVDDSRTALMHAKKTLECHPYHVATADDGQKAWAYLQDHKPDLIICARDMSKLDGFQLLKMVRRDIKLADVPVIIMSENVPKDVAMGTNLGCDSVLPKPYKVDDLVGQVRFLLQE